MGKSKSLNDKVKQLGRIMAEYKLDKGAKGQNITHTCYGPPYGSYNIPDDRNEEFLECCAAAVKAGMELHFIERQREVGPLAIDIDWHFDDDHSERQYTKDDIKYLIKEANTVLKKYYKTNSKKFNAFVFEKEFPCKKKDNDWKDGFHILYPETALDKGMRYLILDELKEAVKDENGFSHIPYKEDETYDKIFDMSIVMGGWTMYGSTKENGPLYSLNSIYGHDLKKKKTDKYTDDVLVKLLSVRRFDEDDITSFKESASAVNIKNKIERVLEKYDSRKNKRKAKKLEIQRPEESDDEEMEDEDQNTGNRRKKKVVDVKDIKGLSKEEADNITLARKLLNLLSPERATEYQSWISVGWVLYNVSKHLYGDWVNFSMRTTSDNFDDSACRKVWDDADDEGGLTIRSLRSWARKDNPSGYVEIISETVSNEVEKADRGTHYAIAKVIHALWEDEYRCSSVKRKEWFQFQGHKWVLIDGGYTLNIRISEELSCEFLGLSAKYYAKAAEAARDNDPDTKERYHKKGDSVMKIIKNLETGGFKKSVMEECTNLFHESDFVKKLDSSRDLIGFENGVYDLKSGTFRDGSPDDYLTFSAGYDYPKHMHMDHSDIGEIKKYFSQVMTEKDMREYVLTLLASYLDGHITQQKFVFWTGSGGNSKSVTIEFFRFAVGDYFANIPNTVISRKQGSSSGATPELAMLAGKRFVTIQEFEHDDTFHAARMKELTGGDPFQARRLFGDPFMLEPQFKILATCNKLPHIPTTDGGTWRRLRVTPFESEFIDHDKEITNPKRQFYKDYNINTKIKRLAPAFMWYLLKVFYPLYLKEGLREPKKVTQYTDKYRESSDVYMSFIKEHYTITKKNRDHIDLVEMYEIFKGWFIESNAGRGAPGPRSELRSYLESNNFSFRGNYVLGISGDGMVNKDNDEDTMDIDEF